MAANLRKLAQGRDCQIRLEGCNHNPETVCLTHIRVIGISGMGLKSPDWLGAWGCSECHRRVDTEHLESIRLRHFIAMAHTLYALEQEGWRWTK